MFSLMIKLLLHILPIKEIRLVRNYVRFILLYMLVLQVLLIFWTPHLQMLRACSTYSMTFLQLALTLVLTVTQLYIIYDTLYVSRTSFIDFELRDSVTHRGRRWDACGLRIFKYCKHATPSTNRYRSIR